MYVVFVRKFKGTKMELIKGKSLNDVIFKLLELLLKSGYETDSRNGPVISLYDVEIIIENPRARHLSLIGRNNNIFATFAESFWILAGETKIDPYLSFFLPRAAKYSDDGENWRGAYGERLYAYDQLENVVDTFKEEGIFTRRAVLSLYMPNRDTKTSLKEKYNLTSSLDIPCNNLIHFFITPDKKLNMKVVQRSGDIIFGISHINIFEFSLLHEMLLHILKLEVDKELMLGIHHHSVTNLHLYDDGKKQAIEILKNKTYQKLDLVNTDKIYFPISTHNNKEFFSGIVNQISQLIASDLSSYEYVENELKTIFKNFDVPIEENLLWGYTETVISYVFQEKFNKHMSHSGEGFCDEFNNSIENNFFKKEKCG